MPLCVPCFRGLLSTQPLPTPSGSYLLQVTGRFGRLRASGSQRWWKMSEKCLLNALPCPVCRVQWAPSILATLLLCSPQGPPLPLHPPPMLGKVFLSHSFVPPQPQGSQPCFKGCCCHRPGQAPRCPKGLSGLSSVLGTHHHQVVPLSSRRLLRSDLHWVVTSAPGRRRARTSSILQVRIGTQAIGTSHATFLPLVPALPPRGEPPGLMVGLGEPGLQGWASEHWVSWEAGS